MTRELRPPDGGLVAIESVLRAPAPKPELGWLDRLKFRLTGRNLGALLAPAVRARQAFIVGNDAAFESFLNVYGIPFRHWDLLTNPPDDAFVFVSRNALLDTAAQQRLADWIRHGGRAVLEYHTPLAERLDFGFEGAGRSR